MLLFEFILMSLFFFLLLGDQGKLMLTAREVLGVNLYDVIYHPVLQKWGAGHPVLQKTHYEPYSIAYVLIHPTTHPHDPCATLIINNNQRNSEADSYVAPPKRRLSFFNESSYYTPYLTATSSFTPRYAPVTPSSYQQPRKREK